MDEKTEAEMIDLQNFTQLLSDRAEACTKTSSQQNPIASDSGASALERTGRGSINEFVHLPPLW